MIQKTGSDRNHRMIASTQTARAGGAEIRLRIMSTVRAPALDAPLDAPFRGIGRVPSDALTVGKSSCSPMSTWAGTAFCRAKTALQNIFERKTPSLSLRLTSFGSAETPQTEPRTTSNFHRISFHIVRVSSRLDTLDTRTPSNRYRISIEFTRTRLPNAHLGSPPLRTTGI